jgi:hypothetical protein
MINLLISVERLNDIQICPKLYFYKHELGQVPIEKPTYFQTGELMHEILRSYYQARIDSPNTLINWQQFIELGRNYAAKKLTLTAQEVEETIRDASMYFTYYANSESWDILGVEEPFAKELFSNEQFRIVVIGKTDLRVVTNRGKGPQALIDHKYESRFEQKVERDNQPLAYCWAFELRDFIYNRIGKQKTKKVEEKLLRPYLSYSQYQIDEWVESAIESANEIIRYVSANKWPMRIHGCNVHGRKCTYYDVCNTTPDNRQYKLDSFFKDKEKYSVMGDTENESKD